MEDEDGGKLMEKIERICKNDPSAFGMIERIIDDLLRVTDQEVDALQTLYKEAIRKAKG